MAKYVFFTFPAYGHINPTLAIVQELVARGEEVAYFHLEKFRAPIESAGATFHPYTATLFQHDRPQGASAIDDNRRLAMLPIYMIHTSAQMVSLLLERVQAERPDCIVYSSMFVWARIIASTLGIPGVALRPSYAPNAQFRGFLFEGLASSLSPAWLEVLNAEVTHLCETYHLPFSDMTSLIRGKEGLTLVFLPRAFQPDGNAFDERVVFVGPSFHPERDRDHHFPRERLSRQPRLYISLGTIFNNQADFYNLCFHAFGNTEWQVILSLGNQLAPSMLHAIPENFITVAHVPQLEILPQTDIFLSHGGMNSTMESLYYGVPLIVLPHINEQKMTAQRVQALGLGIALDEVTVTADALRSAVSRITHEPAFKKRVQAMQHHVREAGGYQRATDALQNYVFSQEHSG